MKNLRNILLTTATALVVLSSCEEQKKSPELTVSGLNPADFEMTVSDPVDGDKQVGLYVLKNANGMEVCITNYGGRVVSLVVPDRDGKPTDVVLGYDNIKQYADTLNSPSDYGSSVGRYANRIKDGKITIDGVEYQLRCTEVEILVG